MNDQPANSLFRILVVEDEEPIRKLVLSTLCREGYTVLAAKDPCEAARLHGSALFNIHLLVTDVLMPEMSGAEFAGEMHSLRADLKVIFATGCAHSKTLPAAGTVGGGEVLQKPFTTDDLRNAVKRALVPVQN